ncbi:RNA polymerase II subunit A C-terminal domain phosphatase [Ambystoma mexicanum]|uniref:RNA polymerase II subunit A C-terminal domain phosphatase n=1 Tax=Ambystoma mexicanum TaxID=8296 RepID=UPI0037E88A0A
MEPPGGPRAQCEVRCPGPRPLRLLEWRVNTGSAVQLGSVLALCRPIPVAPDTDSQPQHATASTAERRIKSDRAGVVLELCAQPGQVLPPGGVLVRLEGCSHPVVMKGLCAECGQDLTQLQNKNGKQQVPRSTATVSMVHSVPELMISSEQAELLGREDQHRLQRDKKLVLMVDLDQTLIHTTEQHCQQMSNKGILHFQLGRGEPMLHTRLRPHCKEFLEKIAKLYELHVFTFGSRLYAHTIAGFLDPEKKLFSHRILSRDECIDPFSKTGNLRNLFPCGDSMVCIIDDREDVWRFAPNLITVKKYVYFQGTGDINAPPGSREAQMKKKANHSKKSDTLEPPPLPQDTEESKVSVEEQTNGIGKPKKELNGSTALGSESSREESNSGNTELTGDCLKGPPDHIASIASTKNLSNAADSQTTLGQDNTTIVEHLPTKDTVANELGTVVEKQPSKDTMANDLELSSDSESETDARKSPTPSSSDSENEEKRSWKRSKNLIQDAPEQGCKSVQKDKQVRENHTEEHLPTPSLKIQDKPLVDQKSAEHNEHDGLCDLGNGCADKKEAETESQNSEQSGITAGESLDQSMEDEDDDEEDNDEDDHLIYLEEILVRVHNDYFTKYEKYLKKEMPEIPDIRKIVPELKGRVLEDVVITFSGLHPTNYPIERTREHYHARALGARISKNLNLKKSDPNHVTHLVAARAGTEKVRQAQGNTHLHIVNPDWLWSCLERWEKVEEQLFPLKEDYIKTQRSISPATFPDVQSAFQTALFHPTPIHPKVPPGPEVRIYDPNTGKLIRKGSQSSAQSPYIQAPAPPLSLPGHGEHSSFRVVQPHQEQVYDDEDELHSEGQDEEQAGPSRRKRQPSMSESMPLYTLCKEDLESMDKEVDDILGEGSDDSDSEKKKAEEEEAPQSSAADSIGAKIEPRPGSSSSSDRSLTGSVPRGHKRKLDEEDNVSVSSKESSNEDEEGSSSEADEMAAALEAELNDFM